MNKSTYIIVGLSALVIGFLVYIQINPIKYPLAYPPSGKKIAFGVTCMDLRFSETQHRFLRKTYGQNTFDSFVVPGPALALGRSTGLVTTSGTFPDPRLPGLRNARLDSTLVEGSYTGDLVDVDFYNAFKNAFAISAVVNASEELVLIEHENCGYYYAVAARDDNSEDPMTAQTIKESQFANLALVRDQLALDLGIPDTRIKCYWVSLKGLFVEI